MIFERAIEIVRRHGDPEIAALASRNWSNEGEVLLRLDASGG